MVNYNTIGLFFTIYPLRLERVLFNNKVHEASDCDATIGSANKKVDFALLINETSHTVIASDCPKCMETVV